MAKATACHLVWGWHSKEHQRRRARYSSFEDAMSQAEHDMELNLPVLRIESDHEANHADLKVLWEVPPERRRK